MMKVKLFTDENTLALQVLVNRWLDDNPSISIKHVLQSESLATNSQSWVTLTIVYESVDDAPERNEVDG